MYIIKDMILKESENKLIRPLMRVGQSNDGRFDFKEKDLKEILKNTKLAIKDGHRVVVKLGHYDQDQVAKGWVSSLRMGTYEEKGKKYRCIYGNLTDLTEEVKLAVSEGRLPQVSVEISRGFVTKAGVEIGALLNAVALLGVDRPAIHFSEEKEEKKILKQFNRWKEKKLSKKNTKENLMNFEEQYKEIVMLKAGVEAENIKLKAEFDVKEGEIKKLSELSTAKDEEIKTLKAENDELKPVKEALLKLKSESYANTLIEERKIIPAQKEAVIAFYAKNGKEEAEKMFGNFPKINEALFSEQSSGEEGKKEDNSEETKLIQQIMGTEYLNEKKEEKK